MRASVPCIKKTIFDDGNYAIETRFTTVIFSVSDPVLAGKKCGGSHGDQKIFMIDTRYYLSNIPAYHGLSDHVVLLKWPVFFPIGKFVAYFLHLRFCIRGTVVSFRSGIESNFALKHPHPDSDPRPTTSAPYENGGVLSLHVMFDPLSRRRIVI
jgi:hypothetical protein